MKINTRDLTKDIKKISTKIIELRKQLNGLNTLLLSKTTSLKSVCKHPHKQIISSSESRMDTLGCYRGCTNWWYCKQCGAESDKKDWTDWHNGQILKIKSYEKFTGRSYKMEFGAPTLRLK